MVALRTDAAAFVRQDQSDRRSLIEAPRGIWHKATAAFKSGEILARSTVMSAIAGAMSGAQCLAMRLRIALHLYIWIF
jgi:hypothetical protein